MEDCLFCKIIHKEIPAEILYEDDRLIAFKDVNPQAPVHILVIPKDHIESSNDLNEENSDLIGDIFLLIKKLTKEFGIDKDGYRIVNNCGQLGGQTVSHIHFHILGGRQLMWPPG